MPLHTQVPHPKTVNTRTHPTRLPDHFPPGSTPQRMWPTDPRAGQREQAGPDRGRLNLRRRFISYPRLSIATPSTAPRSPPASLTRCTRARLNP
eukprot:357597-Chlamydomonas_euryale.AAC.2